MVFGLKPRAPTLKALVSGSAGLKALAWGHQGTHFVNAYFRTVVLWADLGTFVLERFTFEVFDLEALDLKISDLKLLASRGFVLPQPLSALL